MTTRLDVGGLVYLSGIGVAVLNYTPPLDRAAVLTRINLSNVSASDTWDLTIGGRVINSFRHDTTATTNQHLLRVGDSPTAMVSDYFNFVVNQLGLDPSYPVPNGLTATFSSRGGATADIDFEVIETDSADQSNAAQLNHPLGTQFLMPLAWVLTAAVPAVAANPPPVSVDTQFAPAWIPNIAAGAGLPVNWRIELLALFLEGQGRNTFSGAADHQSTTLDVRFVKNGTPLFSRVTTGIPNRGAAAAAGSANSVFGQRSGIFPPFERASLDQESVLKVPIVLRGGDSMLIQEEFQGDTTGTADYSHALQVAIARVTVPSGAGSI